MTLTVTFVADILTVGHICNTVAVTFLAVSAVVSERVPFAIIFFDRDQKNRRAKITLRMAEAPPSLRAGPVRFILRGHIYVSTSAFRTSLGDRPVHYHWWA